MNVTSGAIAVNYIVQSYPGGPLGIDTLFSSKAYFALVYPKYVVCVSVLIGYYLK